ncbi:MAG TPA: hypothetical protein VHF26_22055 [Trebonia sp.]|nr:hypothetical protein [Trebonia sp.]
MTDGTAAGVLAGETGHVACAEPGLFRDAAETRAEGVGVAVRQVAVALGVARSDGLRAPAGPGWLGDAVPGTALWVGCPLALSLVGAPFPSVVAPPVPGLPCRASPLAAEVVASWSMAWRNGCTLSAMPASSRTLATTAAGHSRPVPSRERARSPGSGRGIRAASTLGRTSR